tara:strand:+ start:204 stop:686 length:483 start_codon:yes stop_codon:yes gene_type:complete
MKKLLFVSIFALIALPVSASAASYGSAGCGLGSMIFEPSDDFMQVFAATFNGTSASQTFGISTGTSNCSGAEATASLDQQAFVKINYASLVRDAARGNGEYLSAFATLLGCDANSHTAFFNYAQTNPALFNSNTQPLEVLKNVKLDLAKNETFSNSCTRL